MRKFKKFLAELLVACMVIGAVPFTAFAEGMHTVSVTVDPNKGYFTNLSETQAASGSTVYYGVKAKYGYEHTKTEINGSVRDEVPGEAGEYVGAFDMPDEDVTIHPYFQEDGKVRYPISFVTPVETIHYIHDVTNITDSYGEESTNLTAAAAGDTVEFLAESTNIDYEITEVDVARESTGGEPIKVTRSGDTYSFEMPAEPVLINITEALKESTEYTITTVAGNGSVYVVEKALSGQTVSFRCEPEDGYELIGVSVEYDSTNVPTNKIVDGVYEFTMPNANVTITATFTKRADCPFSINNISTVNCDVTFSKRNAGKGDAIYMGVKPYDDYYIYGLTVTTVIGKNEVKTVFETLADGKSYYKFLMPDDSVNVRVVCKQNPHGQYAITVTNNTEQCAVYVPTDADEGETVHVNVEFNTGWKLNDLSAWTPEKDGGTQVPMTTADTGWEFTMPAGPVEVFVGCKSTSHAITVAPFDPVMGVVNVNETAIAGDTVNVAVIPAQGYEVKSVAVNDGSVPVSQPVVGKDNYTFVMPDADAAVTVTLVPERDVTFGLAGTYQYGTAQIKDELGAVITESALGKTINVDYEPKAGYHLNDSGIKITKTIGTETSDVEFSHIPEAKKITFTMPNADVNVELTFSKTSWDVATASTSGHGTINVSQSTAEYQSLITVTAGPETDYHVKSFTVFESLSGNEVPFEKVGDSDKWLFTMPDAAVSVDVEFEQDETPTYAVTVSVDEEMCKPISVDPQQEAAAVQFEVECKTGYHVVSVESETVTVNLEGTTASFTMPAGPVAITVTCAPNSYTVTDKTTALNKKRGTVTITPNGEAAFNETVEIACVPEDGYEVETVTVKAGKEIVKLSQPVVGVDKYTFVMPNSKVTVEVAFALTGKTWKVCFGDYGLSFVKSFTIVTDTGDPVTITNGEANVLPETNLTATVVLTPGTELESMYYSGATEDETPQIGFDADHNQTWTYKFTMPNAQVDIYGKYSTFQWIVNVDTDNTESGRLASITTDCGKDRAGNYIAEYGSKVTVHAEYNIDDAAVLSVKDNTTEQDIDVTPLADKKTWEFIMPNDQVYAVLKVSKAVHTINADTTQSNGTYQVCFEGGAPASAGVRGTQIYIVTSPDEGYEVATVTVAKGSGDEIEYSVPTPNQYYVFTIPEDFTDVEDTVKIAVTFQETIAKICQEAQAALVAPKADLNTVSGNAAAAHDLVIAAKSQAKTQAKKDALSEADTALLAEKTKVDAMIAAIETLEGYIAAGTTDRDAALGYREAANLYAGGYQVLVASCNNAIQATEAPKAIKECLVSFATNGGSAVASQWLVSGTKAVKPEAPTYQGYYFVDWYSDADLKNAFDFNAAIKQNTTIYAGWTKAKAYNGGGSSGGGSVKSSVPTFSKFWTQDAAGTWRIKDKAGNYVVNAWLCDNAVLGNGQNVWYLLNADGSMITAPLVQDNTGNYYSLEMNHNGYYGMLRYVNGTYDGIYMEFSQKHDGTFGAITNQSAIDALKAKYGVVRYGIDNSNSVYTKDFN